MPVTPNKFSIAIVSACMTKIGTPDFALNEVDVTEEEYENGVHYDLVEELLAAEGYEEPFVHYDDRERPHFLLPAVQKYLGLPVGSLNHDHSFSQEED